MAKKIDYPVAQFTRSMADWIRVFLAGDNTDSAFADLAASATKFRAFINLRYRKLGG